jgi:hypothetical protein
MAAMPKYRFSRGKVTVDSSVYSPIVPPRERAAQGGVLIIVLPFLHKKAETLVEEQLPHEPTFLKPDSPPGR